MAIVCQRLEPSIIHVTWTDKITYEDVKASIFDWYDDFATAQELPVVLVIDVRQARLPHIDIAKTRDIFKIKETQDVLGFVFVGINAIISMGGKVITKLFHYNTEFADTLEAGFEKARAMRDAYLAKHGTAHGG